MDTVKEMLDVKGRGIWSIEAFQSIYQAIEKMAEMEVGALTVLDGDSHLAGIVSERDYARKVILKNKSSRETHVADVMTTKVVFVGEDTSVEQCMSLMGQKKIRHLPVMDPVIVTDPADGTVTLWKQDPPFALPTLSEPILP